MLRVNAQVFFAVCGEVAVRLRVDVGEVESYYRQPVEHLPVLKVIVLPRVEAA
jgi:hypothetical protein